jgi:hypothetical protein
LLDVLGKFLKKLVQVGKCRFWTRHEGGPQGCWFSAEIVNGADRYSVNDQFGSWQHVDGERRRFVKNEFAYKLADQARRARKSGKDT